MAILFSGTEESKTRSHVLECFATNDENIRIDIDMDGVFAFINLDKQTAIRLAKELRRQIALLEVWLWAKKKDYYSNFIEAISM